MPDRATVAGRSRQRHARLCGRGGSRRTSIRHWSRTASRSGSRSRSTKDWSTSSRGRPGSSRASRRVGRCRGNGTGVHVQPAPRRRFHDGTAFNAPRRVRELQPLVQLQRSVPRRVRDVLLPADLRRVQAEQREGAVPELPCGRAATRDHHAASEERAVPAVARAVGVRDAEPGGDGALGREPGRDPERRVPADRDVRVPASDRDGPVPPSRGGRRPAGRAQRNPTYWGRPPRLTRIIIRPIADNTARVQALQTGEVSGWTCSRRSSSRPSVATAAEGPQPSGVQRRVRDDPLVEAADERHPRAAGRRVRTEPAARRPLVLRRARAGGAPVHAAEPAGLRTEGDEVRLQPDAGRELLRARPTVGRRARSSSGTRRASRVRTCRTRRRTSRPSGRASSSPGFDVEARSAPWRPDYVANVNQGTAGTPEPDRLDGGLRRSRQLHRHVLPGREPAVRLQQRPAERDPRPRRAGDEPGDADPRSTSRRTG